MQPVAVDLLADALRSAPRTDNKPTRLDGIGESQTQLDALMLRQGKMHNKWIDSLVVVVPPSTYELARSQLHLGADTRRAAEALALIPGVYWKIGIWERNAVFRQCVVEGDGPNNQQLYLWRGDFGWFFALAMTSPEYVGFAGSGTFPKSPMQVGELMYEVCIEATHLANERYINELETHNDEMALHARSPPRMPLTLKAAPATRHYDDDDDDDDNDTHGQGKGKGKGKIGKQRRGGNCIKLVSVINLYKANDLDGLYAYLDQLAVDPQLLWLLDT